MPAVTPHKKMAYTKTIYSRPFPKASSSAYRDNRFGTQANSYSMHTGNRTFTMFDKVYRHTPAKSVNRISKKNRTHRITEVERCTNIEQREQYRQLIEQYRTKSLAETEQIFCRQNTSSSVVKPINRTTFIDLSETIQTKSTSKFMATPRQSLFPLKAADINCNGSFLELPSVKQSNKTNFQSYKSFLNAKADLENKFKDSDEQEQRRHKPTSAYKHYPASSNGATQPHVKSPSTLHTPTAVRSPVDWFSPSSPYLCKTFVKDLVSSYGRRERERKRMLAEEETRARLLKEKRELKDEMLSELLEARLRVVSEPEVELIPELTMEMDEAVDAALMPHPQHQLLIERFNISITRQHMVTLSGLNWLNDEIINFYMELIVERSKTSEGLPRAHAMNTFFYPKLSTQGYKSVRRWTKRVDIFSKNLLFFPIHLGVHWTLAVADFRAKEILYYDSMGGINMQCLETMKGYLASEHQDKKKSTLDISEWKTITKSQDEIPQQMNGSDCGVFTCTFAEYISRDSPLSFHQDDMPLIRRTMVWEILKGKLTR